MLSRTFVAALVATVAASPCRPPPSTKPTLPSTGTIDLPAPNPSGTLRAIAVGHGIQNYTCADGVATATAAGALAVLYDVTPFYPGGASSLSMEGFNSLTTAVLWTQDLPLNLVDPAAAKPGTPDAPNKDMPPSAYGAAAGNPFSAAADIKLGEEMPPLKFLGHHYFDAAGVPTFDLSARNMRFSVGLKESVNQPAESDKGILGTGAVKWLLLNDSGKGLSTLGANSQVYRVITAGGVAQACSKEGAVPKGSVPYTAFYWFYG